MAAQITLATPICDYLAMCEDRGANADGECRAFAWVKAQFSEADSMADALDALGGSPAAMESAMFAFEHMLDVLSPSVRERFAGIISLDNSSVIHALNWRRLVKYGDTDPSETEDWLLRKSWHSKWQGVSKLPAYEADE